MPPSPVLTSFVTFPFQGVPIGMELFPLLLLLLVFAIALDGLWKTYVKAGEPGWAAIVPVYNAYVMLKIAGRPAWWLLLLLVPVVNLAVAVLVGLDVAKSFGKGAGFGLGLAFLGFVFFPLLGYGDAEYRGPAAT